MSLFLYFFVGVLPVKRLPLHLETLLLWSVLHEVLVNVLGFAEGCYVVLNYFCLSGTAVLCRDFTSSFLTDACILIRSALQY